MWGSALVVVQSFLSRRLLTFTEGINLSASSLAKLGDFFEKFFGLVGGVDFGEVMDEFAIAEEEGFAAWFVVGVDDFEGVADFPIGVGEEGKGETEFIRE